MLVSMANINIFWRDWRANLNAKPKQPWIILDHETGKVISERKIKEETQEAFLRAIIEMASKNQGL